MRLTTFLSVVPEAQPMSTKSLSSPLILEPGAGVGAEWGLAQTPPIGLGVGEVGESPITTATTPGLATNSIQKK